MSVIDKTKAEQLKEESQGLRGSLVADLGSDEGKFGLVSETLLKFHGIYQQKDRDRRLRDPAAGAETVAPTPKPFTLMVRGRIPGGRLSWRQWLAWDDVASRYGANGLRLTTRQSLQIHGVLKRNLKDTIQAINAALISTTGACGDVVRNVTQAVNPLGDPRLTQLDRTADLISKHFEVESHAYFEIFLDGKPMIEERPDPIYGGAYLPRKFKIGVTAVSNNGIDLYTQDLGLAATYDPAGKISGYFVFVGGGMGMAHGDGATHPRLADSLGWIPESKLLQVSEAVVTTQRDFGNRQDRAFARLKYTIENHGLEWFRAEVQRRAQVVFEDRPLPPWETPSYLGWKEHRDGTLTLGFHTLSGRVVDTAQRPLRSTLRAVIERFRLSVQLTADQDLILFGIKPEDKRAVETILDSHGLSPESPRKLYDRALTCVALPTCSKALAEAERVGPQIFGWLQEELDRHQRSELAPVVRITGCPNGCARPYTAELALVGQMPGHYAVFAGGDAEGRRLAQKLRDKVKFQDLPAIFGRLVALWAEEGRRGEGFGDFVQRYGHGAVSEVL